MRGTEMSEAEKFFYDPATETQEEGKLRCAKETARAEALAHELIDAGLLKFSWEWDPDYQNDTDIPDRAKEIDEKLAAGEWEACGLVLEGRNSPAEPFRIIDSLWGIVGTHDAAMRRMYEGDMACGALEELERLARYAALWKGNEDRKKAADAYSHGWLAATAGVGAAHAGLYDNFWAQEGYADGWKIRKQLEKRLGKMRDQE